MEIVEIVIFLLFAVISGGLILTFLIGTDFTTIQNTLFETFNPSKEISDFEKTNYLGLLKNIDLCWNNCAFGDRNIDCGTIFLTDEKLSLEQKTHGLDGNFFIDLSRRLHFCEYCNISLDNNLKPPTIINIQCKEGEIKLIN